ncbi:hypothetical protein [Vallitalea guaymasensis]|uniref:Uncharacterized protein n=1 Tax=Vallitalea guaymasensis TaxID=1185412 RepID=A0A8J8M948_9FIRM|nr:hypothetical protein [Vallitalea guaymasensis]QUH28651.1 hypothetical protein HYG85_06880 [Vallitalea guaymasensis]
MRKIKLLLLTVLLTSVLSVGVNAQGDRMIVEESRIGNTLLRATLDSVDDPLSYCTDSISSSSGYLVIDSNTFSNQTCDKLELQINLQENKNGSWSTIKTYSYTSYNTSSISKYPTYSSQTVGAKYRVKTYHYAEVDGETYVKIITSPEVTAK